MRAAVLFAVLLVATTANAEVTRSYDRFKDRTEVTSNKEGPMSIQYGTLNLMWGFRHSGELMQTKPGTIDLIINVFNKSWEYLRCHSVAFLADGKPVAVESSKHIGDVDRGFVMEKIISTIKADAVSQLAKAHRVEMQVCRTEYTFDDGDMKVLREFEQALNVSPP